MSLEDVLSIVLTNPDYLETRSEVTSFGFFTAYLKCEHLNKNHEKKNFQKAIFQEVFPKVTPLLFQKTCNDFI